MNLQDLIYEGDDPEKKKKAAYDEVRFIMDHVPIKNIVLEGFKVFRIKKELEFSPITFLIGENSSGKSSLIEIFKILSKNSNVDKLSLENLVSKIGSFSNVISKGKSHKTFSIEIPTFLNDIQGNFKLQLVYKINSNNHQICELCHFNLLIDDKSVVKLSNPSGTLLKGYVDFPYFWEKFRLSFENSLSLSPNTYEYKLSRNFFKGNTQGYVRSDFDTIPPIYLMNVFVDNELSEEYISKWNLQSMPYDDLVRFLCQEELEILSNFHFQQKVVTGNLLNDFIRDVSSPFNYLIGSLDENPNTPMRQLLSLTGRNSNGNYFLEPTLLHSIFIYFNYFGMDNSDIKKLESVGNYGFYENAMKSQNISLDAKSIIQRLYRMEFLRNDFFQFISENVDSAFKNCVPRALFVPVNRSEQQMLMHNFGKDHDYKNILQKAAVQWVNLTVMQRSAISQIISNSVELFKIGEEFEISTDGRGALSIFIKRGKYSYHISEEGFGISQLFSMILSICVFRIAICEDQSLLESQMLGADMFLDEPVSVFIEEPESNLHPNFQSKLADLFVMLSKRMNIQFVIETHSEYIIRRMRLLTTKWYLGNEDDLLIGVPKEFWKCYYFSHRDRTSADRPLIYDVSVIDEKGFLNREFGEGFIDASTQIEMEYLELLNIKSKSN